MPPAIVVPTGFIPEVPIPKLPPDYGPLIETKVIEPTPPVISAPEDRYWPGSASKSYKEKEYATDWESATYNSHSRSSSKYDDDFEYSRSSGSKYYDRKDREHFDSRKDRSDREFGKYGHHREERSRDRERSHRDRDRDKERRDYRSKDDWKDRERTRKDREYYDYGREGSSKERYSSSKSYSRPESFGGSEAPGYGYDAYGYSSSSSAPYGYNYPYPPASGWAPPPPKGPPEDDFPKPPPEPAEDWPPPAPPNEDDDDGDNDELSSRIKSKAVEDESTVDLDTRIAMLFNAKSFGEVPAFKLGDDSDKEIKQEDGELVDEKSDDGEFCKKLNNQLTLNENSETSMSAKKSHKSKLKSKDEIDAMEEGELKDVTIKKSPISDESTVSTIPSPFESRISFKINRKFLKSRKRKRPKEKVKVESGASDISSSDDELLAKGTYSPLMPHPDMKDDDQMSLSSLSSTEPIKTDPDVVIKSENKDFDPTSYMYPMAFSSYTNAAYYYQQSFHQFQQPQWMASGVGYDSYYNLHKKDHQSTTDDPHEAAVKKVISKLIQELKQILKKDINKRMIENTAFKKYEAWWNEQERNKNTRSYHHETIAITTTSTVIEPPTIAVKESSVLDTYQSAGLGILRNLRFQRIKREPAPIQLEEDSRKSDPDDEDVVHGSDSEKEDIQPSSKTTFIKRRISASSSSESSESSDSSSDDEEEERDANDYAYSSDTASLVSDDELDLKAVPLRKDKENSRIYSDSESDAEISQIPVQKTAKPKPKIYSDSEDDETSAATAKPTVEEKSEKLKTPAAKRMPVHPAESDSDFFNDDVMSKPPRTPGRTSSSEDQQAEKPKLPVAEIKPSVSENRFYSDSEEEREYQEKIRRNTEWMEQTEREAKEEMERQRLAKEQQKEELTSTDTSRAPSPSIESIPKLEAIQKSRTDGSPTPTLSLPPPTPGASIISNPLISKLDQDSGKKKRGRPKGSITKPKEPKPKQTKNGAIAKIDAEKLFAQPQKPDEQQKYSLKLSPSSSSDGGSSQASLVALEHCYSLPPSASPSPLHHQEAPQAVNHLDHDHAYYGKSDVTPLQSIQPGQLDEHVKKEHITSAARPVGRPRKDPNAPKAQYTKKGQIEKPKAKEKSPKKIDYRQHQIMAQNFVPVSRYGKREPNEEFEAMFRFLTNGIDQEDVDYMRKAYSYLIQSDTPGTELLHQVHWVDHCSTDRSYVPSPPKKRRRDNDLPDMRHHATGCARTEGYYKIDSKDKAHYKYHHLRGTVAGSHLDHQAKMAVAKMQNASREARSNQRRLLTAFGGATESDLLKFNQLKFRKKQLKFAKSAIHDWGLFAMEPIAADEMVIEYVGQMVRPSVADLRETKYEAIGIGSSYLFRIDMETIIDATKCGNLARFINHSCNVSNRLMHATPKYFS